MTMTIRDAQAATVEWLREGGKPNDTIPFRYSYQYPRYSPADRCGCAGAAIAYLTGLPDCEMVGDRFFGDGALFFGLIAQGVSVDSPRSMATFVERLRPVDV